MQPGYTWRELSLGLWTDSDGDVSVEVTTDGHGGLNVILAIEEATGRIRGLHMMEGGLWRDYPTLPK